MPDELGFKDGAIEMKGGLVKKWRRQWVVVKSGLLQYFDTETFPEGVKPSETLRLAGCTVRICDRKEHKKDHVLSLKYAKGKKPAELFFAATDEADLTQWRRAIKDSIYLASPIIFGVDLRIAAQKAAPEDIPAVILQAIECLGPHLQVEGIFRLSGSAKEIASVKSALDAGGALDQRTDPIVVAGVLKQYLRELPEPLLTFKLYEEWLPLGRLSPAEFGPAAHELVKRLPSCFQSTLLVLLRFLSEVTEYEETNKMSSVNLATCIGPTILRPRTDTMESAANSDITNKVADLLIRRWKYVFGLAKDESAASGGGAAPPSGNGPPPAAPSRARKPTVDEDERGDGGGSAGGGGGGGGGGSRWIEKDDGYGNVYWFDPETRTKRYDRPDDMGDGDGGDGEAGGPLSPRGRGVGGIDPTAALKGLRAAPARRGPPPGVAG
eukprot:CAMPEP_0170743656 /NCGR_PEP_ID=MMETSP0437-20130122/7380_1 /TAXON_ID=0 /ORGANISM="Sexangularia sp." /LENGTH=437 /DNA_ID=CAMNT_0011082331 /DNA_START=44 /DNA_END=1353 /DNA_ORIENTATION=-